MMEHDSLDDDDDDSSSISSSTSSNHSVDLNETATTEDNHDRESIGLLRQIFPEEPVQELRRMHRERLDSIRQRNSLEDDGPDRSNDEKQQESGFPILDLAPDFLRLPTNVAVLRYQGEQLDSNNQHDSRYRYESLDKLEQQVIQASGYQEEQPHIFTRAVFRDPQMGLGMTLAYDEQGQVQVHSVAGEGGATMVGPCMKAGIRPGDVILGFNGYSLDDPLFRKSKQETSSNNLLQNVVQLIRDSPDPVVIHGRRRPPPRQSNNEVFPPPYVGASLLDETLLDTSTTLDDDLEPPPSPPLLERTISHHPQSVWSTPVLGQNGEPRIHRLVQLLSSRNLVPSIEEEMNLTAALAQFHERAWEMEHFCSLRINQRGFHEDALIPLVGVRKALSARILHHFTTEGTRVAYTIWVYDVESGLEWYAPLRYMEDFVDLRQAVTHLISSLGKVPFPRQQSPLLLSFGSPRHHPNSSSPAIQEAHCWQLEKFLQCLCSLLYENQLHPAMGEVAVHVQSFLGCESIDFDSAASVGSTVNGVDDANDKNKYLDDRAKNLLKRSIQCYTYRVFLLKPLTFIVDDFVESMRQKCPSLQDLETIESQGVDTLQKMALEDLAALEKFLDFMQSTIIEGCRNDFRSITMHDTFARLTTTHHFRGRQGEIAWNALVREAVREQVEVEVYVPLRSVVSRWLVNGWRHEDMEAHFKIKELRQRPMTFFNIPEAQSSWTSAATILKETLEQSTLPCAKLQAIVEAAREIARISQTVQQQRNSAKSDTAAHHEDDENGGRPETTTTVKQQLGADQFLPILIYCVVMANMDRPCALCVLLRSLCDKVTKIGEVGYYLASFEAAVMHVRDFDLASSSQQEASADQMPSFVSVNID